MLFKVMNMVFMVLVLVNDNNPSAKFLQSFEFEPVQSCTRTLLIKSPNIM